jgi:predicted Zn-dependent protease
MKTIQKRGHFRHVALLSSALLIAACSVVPVTGRKQLKLLPESTLIEMGLISYNDFLKENELSSDKEDPQMIKKVGSNLSSATNRFLRNNGLADEVSNYKWAFNLVEDKTINAWCMPGGKIVFYTGILPLTKNESGAAVVMGHEIAHAIAKHGNERMSQGLIQQMGGIALSVAIKEKPKETQELYQMAYGLTTNVAVILPYSRKQEYEADRIGLIIMAMAGYNPNEAISFWKRMAAISTHPAPAFLSTHPSDEKRIDQIRKYLPEAMKYYKKK